MLDAEKLNFIKRFNQTKTSKILHADYDPKHNPEFATELKGQVQFADWAGKPGDGRLAAEGGEDDPSNRGDDLRENLKNASSYIERALEGVSDPNLGDNLKAVLATINGLYPLANGPLIPGPRPNPNGATEPLPGHVNSNTISSRRVPAVVSTNQLSDEDKAMRLTAKLRKLSAG